MGCCRIRRSPFFLFFRFFSPRNEAVLVKLKIIIIIKEKERNEKPRHTRTISNNRKTRSRTRARARAKRNRVLFFLISHERFQIYIQETSRSLYTSSLVYLCTRVPNIPVQICSRQRGAVILYRFLLVFFFFFLLCISLMSVARETTVRIPTLCTRVLLLPYRSNSYCALKIRVFIARRILAALSSVSF